MLTAEVLAHVAETRPGLVCIGSLPPGSAAHARYICKRLRAKLPNARIVIGRWGSQIEPGVMKQLKEAGADLVESSLIATRNAMRALWPVLAEAADRKKVAASPMDEELLEPEAVAV